MRQLILLAVAMMVILNGMDILQVEKHASALMKSGRSYQAAQLLDAHGKTEKSLRVMDLIIEREPEEPLFRAFRALLYLKCGDLERGFEEYEWRWKCDGLSHLRAGRELWDGRQLPDQSILLHPEQGLGDVFQFVRYAALVKQRCARTILYCQPPMAPIMKCCPLVDSVWTRGDPIPAFGAETTLMSLPRIFRTSLSSIPQGVPYIVPDRQLVEKWNRLVPSNEFLVGVCWHGSAAGDAQARRSIPREFFESLAQIPGVRLVSLQRDELPPDSPILNLPGVDRYGAFIDSAAIIKNVDVVISSDTSIAHLAGAIGARTWLALPYSADWRWLQQRSDSPWYPTMRLFRQERFGDWDGVFKTISGELRELARDV